MMYLANKEQLFFFFIFGLIKFQHQVLDIININMLEMTCKKQMQKKITKIQVVNFRMKKITI